LLRGKQLFKYYLAFLLGVLFTSTAQICLKIGANKNRERISYKLFINKWTVTGYILFFSVIIFNTYGLTKLPIITGIMFNPFIYILVAVFSFILLGERFTKKQVFGSIIIIIGILVFGLGNLVK
jgi:drug/metabolite transporter (DMT)-like permease